MDNLREETLRVLKEHNKTIEDIKFICSGDKNIPIDMFFIKADRMYDNYAGWIEIDECLMIVGDNWWLERAEYDGSEWWEFRTMPQIPDGKPDYTYTPFNWDRE